MSTNQVLLSWHCHTARKRSHLEFQFLLFQVPGCALYNQCQGLAATSACGSSWTFLFTFLHVTPFVFVLCGKPFQVCKAWKGTIKSLPVHSFNGVTISSASVCTLQSVTDRSKAVVPMLFLFCVSL